MLQKIRKEELLISSVRLENCIASFLKPFLKKRVSHSGSAPPHWRISNFQKTLIFYIRYFVFTLKQEVELSNNKHLNLYVFEKKLKSPYQFKNAQV